MLRTSGPTGPLGPGPLGPVHGPWATARRAGNIDIISKIIFSNSSDVTIFISNNVTIISKIIITNNDNIIVTINDNNN